MSTRRPDERPRAPASDTRVAIEEVVDRYSELPRGGVRQWTPGAISELDGSVYSCSLSGAERPWRGSAS